MAVAAPHCVMLVGALVPRALHGDHVAIRARGRAVGIVPSRQNRVSGSLAGDFELPLYVCRRGTSVVTFEAHLDFIVAKQVADLTEMRQVAIETGPSVLNLVMGMEGGFHKLADRLMAGNAEFTSGLTQKTVVVRGVVLMTLGAILVQWFMDRPTRRGD